ncbi:MAG: sigma 54-interacting transcriptional regulator [Proteobacteria bacterium]|nr:sigma 54-interacting transcriptional regulator [Pseudomonadota bacterium]MBU1570593.1 sigma 54-interacting transcriptional regulator [Pseudomonadota bacterium]
MAKQDEKTKVVPFFKIQDRNFPIDIEELTPVEKISFEKNNLMIAILDTINDGVLTIDFNMRITSFNLAAERITGFLSREAIGKLCFDIFCPRTKIIDRRECFDNCIMKMAVTEGKSITKKKKIINKAGEVLTIYSTATILYDQQGLPIGGMCSFINTTAFEKLKEDCQGKRYIIGNIVGRSTKMMEIYNLIDSISESRANVLILGETGTGKSLLANAIHFSSIYRKGPFIHVNCAALPENLLESELFGHVRGSFTGAISDRQGRLELAQKGTLCLDEIGELSIAMQAKLLSAVEEKRFERVGGTKTINVDVRIISASNKDLKEAIRNGTFREDLFYRLNIIPIHVPPLRERTEDIPILFEYFIEKFNIKTKKKIKNISSEVIDVFIKYSWPGNIRELESVVEYAATHCKHNHIELDNLPPSYLASIDQNKANHSISSHNNRLDAISLEKLQKALEESHWNKNETANRLNISRTTLWRMMKKYGL